MVAWPPLGDLLRPTFEKSPNGADGHVSNTLIDPPGFRSVHTARSPTVLHALSAEVALSSEWSVQVPRGAPPLSLLSPTGKSRLVSGLGDSGESPATSLLTVLFPHTVVSDIFKIFVHVDFQGLSNCWSALFGSSPLPRCTVTWLLST